MADLVLLTQIIVLTNILVSLFDPLHPGSRMKLFNYKTFCQGNLKLTAILQFSSVNVIEPDA